MLAKPHKVNAAICAANPDWTTTARMGGTGQTERQRIFVSAGPQNVAGMWLEYGPVP
jgi:hypothetical protein